MSDLPPESAGRLERQAFSSGLSVPDFAACLHMGMRPVGLVQGFCVMRWSWYGAASLYGRAGVTGRSSWGTSLRSYSCPHYATDVGHRTWGENFQQPWVAKAWTDGFQAAYDRMIEEAQEAGAHGIVGIVDTTSHLIDSSVREFHIYGTAVVVEDSKPPERIWTSYLAGQRLAKLIESGFMPQSVVATMASIRMWSVCTTELLMNGQYALGGLPQPGSEITQFADAQMQVRHMARDQAKRQLGEDTLQGATFDMSWREIAAGDIEWDCTLRGTRIKRFKSADPLPPPSPTVRLS